MSYIAINVIPLCFLLFLNISCINGNNTGSVNKQKTIIADTVNNTVLFSEPDGIKDFDLFCECLNYDNNLSSIVADIRFIPLDIEPLISDFHVLDIELSNDYIFLLGMGYIFQFDRSGRFVKNIGSKGMGPKEFVQLSPPLQLDREKKMLYAFDESRNKILIYQFNGQFEGVISMDSISGNICIIDSTSIALRQKDYTRFQSNSQSICFIDYKGKLRKTYPSNIYPLANKNHEHFGSQSNFMWENNGKFYSLEYGSDTIFRVKTDSLIPERVLKGKFKPEKNELFIQNDTEKNIICFPILRPNAGVFESDNFILFRMLNRKNRFIMVYNKQTKRFHRTYHKDAPSRWSVLLTDYFTDDIVSSLSFDPQYQSQGWAIALISAIDINEKRDKILQFISKHPSEESEKFKKIVQNITEVDNSVLMLVKFK